jgi:hypothetical protein
MRMSLKNQFLLVSLFAALLLVPACFLQMTGHSIICNENWHDGFSAAFSAGDFYPRWIEWTNQGLGAPSFYFYAPLPFWVSSLAEAVWPFTHSAKVWVAVTAGLALWLSGLTMLVALRRFVRPEAAVFAAVVYMAMPYHLGADFWARSALGELWGFVWLPLMIVGFMDIALQKVRGIIVLILATSGLALSHLPSLMIAMCGVGGLFVMTGLLHRDRKSLARIFLHATASLMLAFAVTAAYWLPAVTIQDYTRIADFMFSGWYSYSINLLFVRIESIKFNSMMEFSAISVMCLAAACLYQAYKKKLFGNPVYLTAASGLIFAIFMSSGLSMIIWDSIAVLQNIQFPWRFLLLADVCFCFMLAIHADRWRWSAVNRAHLSVLAITVLTVGIAQATLYSMPMLTGYSAEDYRQQRQSRVDMREYRTVWTDQKYFEDIFYGKKSALRVPEISHGGKVIQTQQAGAYSIQTPRSAVLVLDRFYFPDLVVRDVQSGRQLEVAPQPVTGLAMISVPAGKYHVRLETVLLPQERAGWQLSLVGLLGSILLVTRSRRKPVAAVMTRC